MTNKTIYPESFIKKYAIADKAKLCLPTVDDIAMLETAEYGKGIFALHPYKRGMCIGDFIAKPIKTLKQHSLQRGPNDNLYDPYFIGFLLHSCDPNVVVDMHQHKVYCIRDIDENQPLLMDYASTEDKLFNQFPCGCNAPNCRYWITGRNEFVSNQGLDYLQSFKK